MNVDFITAIKLYFANYANFKGRSTRAEYWWSILFLFLVSFVLSFFRLSLLSLLFSLAVLIPNLAILTRRFHDIGKSGWWVLGLWLCGLVGGTMAAYSFFSVMGLAGLVSEPADPEMFVKAVQTNGVAMGIGYLITLTVGIIGLVFCCKPSGPDNQYGPDPYGENAEVHSL